MRQYKLIYPWHVVVIYPSRNVERNRTEQFREMLALNRVTRIYLDELDSVGENSLGVGVVKLVIENEDTSVELAKSLITQARQQLTAALIKRDLIDLIETIIVYKLPQKSRKEIEAKLGLSELKQTKVYQEALDEGKQEAIGRMLKLGLSLEIIAQSLDLPIEVFQQAAQQSK